MKELGTFVEELLLPHLAASSDEPVLVAGDLAEELAFCIGEIRPDTSCLIKTTEGIFNESVPSKKFPMALIVHQFGQRDFGENALIVEKKLLSRVRDVYAERVLHLVINESAICELAGRPGWTVSDSLEMGFVKLARVQTDTVNIAMYKFDIRHYKADQDWLNSKHWAHPERWGQSR